jgi:hypothetical protein
MEIEYKTCSQEDELHFQQEVVKLLPAYKITGLGVTESKTFKPHQIFMDLNFQTTAEKSSL